MTAPSSSRTFDRQLRAMNSRTSSASAIWSSSAFFRRMATRVSKSGGLISVTSPHSKRETRRSSSPGISFLLAQKMDVVDQEQIDFAVTTAEFRHPAFLNRRNQIVGETLTGYVRHPFAGIARHECMPDGMHEVRFAEPHAAIDE